MKKSVLTAVSVVFTMMASPVFSGTFYLNNTASTNEVVTLQLDCDASWSNNGWNVNDIHHGSYVTANVPTGGNYDRNMGCAIQDQLYRHYDYYLFYYSINNDGVFRDGPGMVEVNPGGIGITFCPHSTYADFRFNQGDDQEKTTTYHTVVTWKSSIHYPWAVGQSIADAVAKRIEGAYVGHDNSTVIGFYDHATQTLRFEITLIRVTPPEAIPEGCTYYPPGYYAGWPPGFEHPDAH